MHEATIAAELITLAQKEAGKAGYPQAVITQVRVRVGALRAVVEESLIFAFDALKVGTPLEHADLMVEKAPVHGECRRCGSPFQPEEALFICAHCGSADLDIRGGDELNLLELTIEDG
jgi:hydrogenase nickel incorporation protein HypA/HybF